MPGMKATTLTTESIEKFRSSLSASGRSSNTVKAYCTDLMMMLQDFETKEIPQEEFCQMTMNWLTAHRKHLSPKTTHRRLTSTRAFARWAGWDSDDLRTYRPPRPAPPQAHPIPEGITGVRRLVSVATTDQQRALIALCGLIGCRVGEALTVRPSDFQKKKEGMMLLTIHGKGDRDRVVPVSVEAWSFITPAFLAAWQSDLPLVNMKDRLARRTITDLGAKARLERPIASHDLRATFATEVYKRTLDLLVVKELLGHSSVEQTTTYTHVRLDTMREAVTL